MVQLSVIFLDATSTMAMAFSCLIPFSAFLFHSIIQMGDKMVSQEGDEVIIATVLKNYFHVSSDSVPLVLFSNRAAINGNFDCRF